MRPRRKSCMVHSTQEIMQPLEHPSPISMVCGLLWTVQWIEALPNLKVQAACYPAMKRNSSVQFLCLERVSVHPVYAQHYPQSNGELPTTTLKALTTFPFMPHVPPVAPSWSYFGVCFMARYCHILVSTVRILNCKRLWRKLSWSTRDANPAFP